MAKKKNLKFRKELSKSLVHELRYIFPAPECALFHESTWQLLVATILSAQCTDKRVNIVTPGLFSKYPLMKDLAEATQSEIEKAIKSTGFYRNKAKNIKACAIMLIENFNSEVPSTLKELITLPGVGRKTANVILGTSFGIAEGIVVDTHVKRLSFRFGLTEEQTPEKIEADLMKLLPKKDWIDFAHLLILHGRGRCKARKPDCKNCEIANVCQKCL